MLSVRALVAMLAVCAVLWSAFAQLRPSPRVTITLPASVASEKVDIKYVLYGSFGAYGGQIRPTPKSSSYLIQTSVDGKPAESVKIIAWAPGCKIETFDIPVNESSDSQQPFPCSPLPTVVLTGQIRPADLVRDKPAEVSVRYLAMWACRFFGFGDCIVPQIALGTAKPDGDGVFEIEVPDFSADLVAAGRENEGDLNFLLRETKTWNHIAMLEPEAPELRSPGDALKILSAYPRNITFVAQSSKPRGVPLATSAER